MKVVVVGAGIMGITFATLARELSPKLEITVIERLSGPAQSNSGVFNNAGTGHEANCELNYTPVDEEEIEVEKALKIHAQFNVAKQFWAWLVKQGIIQDPSSFIHRTKHCTLVAEDAISLLKLRFQEMSSHHFFDSMQYSEDHDEIMSWIPYTMQHRSRSERMAATRIDRGTDVNFQSVTEQMAAHLAGQDRTTFHYNTHVRRIHKSPSGAWLLECQQAQQKLRIKADILFVGAGGGAFPLLKQTHLPDQKRFAGFPVGGRFLMTRITPEQAREYDAKTYGKAKVGAPPMSVPHLDLRNDKGQYYLLFGPFATFKPVLEKGRGFFEYLLSMRLHDIPNLLNVLFEHFPLFKYLVNETLQGEKTMLRELDNFAPGLSTKFDWKVESAGQRVQVIKDGYLQMGTEMVVSDDRSYGTLLGASPGASVSPEIMLRMAEQLFPFLIREPEVQAKLKEIFPVSDLSLLEQDAALYRTVRDQVNTTLGIG